MFTSLKRFLCSCDFVCTLQVRRLLTLIGLTARLLLLQVDSICHGTLTTTTTNHAQRQHIQTTTTTTLRVRAAFIRGRLHDSMTSQLLLLLLRTVTSLTEWWSVINQRRHGERPSTFNDTSVINTHSHNARRWHPETHARHF